MKPVTIIEGKVKEKEIEEALDLYGYCLVKKTVLQQHVQSIINPNR